MSNSAYDRLCASCSSDDKLTDTSEYLYSNLQKFLRKDDILLICLPHRKSTELGSLIQTAAAKAGIRCIFWDEDKRWNTLLAIAFSSKATAIVGAPLILLGLAKLAFYKHVPLNISYAVCAGYPCADWMIDAISQKLDCKVMGILGPGTGPLVSGFSCTHFKAIHLRTDRFQFRSADNSTTEENESKGHITLSPLETCDPPYVLRINGTITDEPCACGQTTPRLGNIELAVDNADTTFKIVDMLQHWSSILDCDVKRSIHGIEIEIICFSGERLPPIPDCSRLILRHWNPAQDIPLTLKYLDNIGDYS